MKNISCPLLASGIRSAQGEPAYCLSGVRHKDGVTLIQALVWNVETCRSDGRGEPLQDLESDVLRQLCPAPVRRVDIPKDNEGTRPLGIPTAADRIAQTGVKRHLGPILGEHFHPNSYGYRPGKSAIEATGVACQRCWRYDWVLELDINGIFDSINHHLLMRAVRKHMDCKWVLLYIER
jgi:retron-type reverse transcriptase